ncbi:MAG: 50S ribosomal protein L20 [Oligoflexia bacterium]|nr:50S ribosomal protein L20 [Oligoflexia bacterium]
MSRAKGGYKTRRRRNKWLKLAKGFVGRRSNVFKIAKLAVIHALQYSYGSRKRKKRMMRQLWNTRIGAAAKMNGFSYSRLIHGLKKSGIELDRKILASIAADDSGTFSTLVETSRKAIG